MIQIENLNKDHILGLILKIIETNNPDELSNGKDCFTVTPDEIVVIYTSIIATLQFCYIAGAKNKSDREAAKLKISTESKLIEKLLDEMIEKARKENKTNS